MEILGDLTRRVCGKSERLKGGGSGGEKSKQMYITINKGQGVTEKDEGSTQWGEQANGPTKKIRAKRAWLGTLDFGGT